MHMIAGASHDEPRYSRLANGIPIASLEGRTEESSDAS
jgi:hypothetical protein